MLRLRWIGKEFLNGTLCFKYPLKSDRVQQDVLKPGYPAQVLRAIIHSIGVYMIDDMLAGWWFPMISSRNDPVNSVAPEVCVSCIGVLGAVGPGVVEFAVPSAGSLLAQYRAVIPNVVNVPFERASSGLFERVDEKV